MFSASLRRSWLPHVARQRRQLSLASRLPEIPKNPSDSPYFLPAIAGMVGIIVLQQIIPPAHKEKRPPVHVTKAKRAAAPSSAAEESAPSDSPSLVAAAPTAVAAISQAPTLTVAEEAVPVSLPASSPAVTRTSEAPAPVAPLRRPVPMDGKKTFGTTGDWHLYEEHGAVFASSLLLEQPPLRLTPDGAKVGRRLRQRATSARSRRIAPALISPPSPLSGRRRPPRRGRGADRARHTHRV